VVRVWASVVLVGVMAGCISGGPPPTGQRLTSGREPVQLAFLGSKPGAPLLVWKDVNNFDAGSDLHLLTLSATGQLVSDRLLAQRVVAPGYSTVSSPTLDSRGRIALTLVTDQSPINYYPRPGALTLVDVATGAQQDLGFVSGYQQSESGDRIVYASLDAVHVHEVDDQDTVLGPISAHVITYLAGEDVYYTVLGDNADADLWRFTRGGTPEHLTDHVSSFTPRQGLLFVTRGGVPPQAGMPPQPGVTSILDPVTLHETPLPASDIVSISPDRRWLVATTYAYDAQTTMPLTVLFETATGASQTLDVPSQYFSGVGWRPGQDGEVWLSTQNGTTLIVRPGSSAPVEIPRQILSSYGSPLADPFVFTRDGKHFLSYQSEFGYLGARDPIYLAAVDDP